MAFKATDFRDFPGAPRVETYPTLSIAVVNNTIPAAGSSVIYHKTNLQPTSQSWIIAPWPIVSWNLLAQAADGASLEIYVSSDDSSYDRFYVFPILKGTRPNVMLGLHLPGMTAKFSLVNASTSAQETITGHIKLQGM